MIKCDHFVYTAAKTNLQAGYQVVARSRGVSEKILSAMEHYMHPIGVDPLSFNESKSLILLDKKTIAYSNVKNIGKGFDGRDGTLYNHTIIISAKDFQQLGYDSRILDRHYVKDYLPVKDLECLQIKNERMPIDFSQFDMEENMLKDMIYLLFRRKRMAIEEINSLNFIQNLLMVLPLEFRMVPFSTFVVNPERQDKFHIIQIPAKPHVKIPSKFSIINRHNNRQLKLASKISNMQPFVNIIRDKNSSELEKIHHEYSIMLTHVKSSRSSKSILNDAFSEIQKSFHKHNYAKITELARTFYSNSNMPHITTIDAVSLATKIRRLIEPRNKKNDMLFSNVDQQQIVPSLKILLNHMNYLKRQNLSKTLEKKIDLEIRRIEALLAVFGDELPEKYEFDMRDYCKSIFDSPYKFLFDIWLWSKKYGIA